MKECKNEIGDQEISFWLARIIDSASLEKSKLEFSSHSLELESMNHLPKISSRINNKDKRDSSKLEINKAS